MSLRPIPLQTIEIQHKASNPDVSAWVSANAGSGKTHVLAQRVVRLLLRGVPPARILCLTFTKAAAANMSMRVFGILAKWTVLDDANLREAIIATGEPRPTAQHLTFARRLFARTVETPGGLKIQTIHAFCEKLLHLFPFEANVAARFEVIEDLRRTELLNEARRRTLLRGIHDATGPLGSALRLLASETSGQTFGELIQEALGKEDLVAAAQRLDQTEGAGSYAALLAAQLGLESGENLEGIERDMLEGGLLAEDCEHMLQLLAAGGVKDGKMAAQFRAALASASRTVKLSLYEALFVTKRDGEPRGMKTQKIVSKKVWEHNLHVLAAFETERDRICMLREKRKAAHVVARTQALLLVVQDILQAYRREKEARGLLDFSDLIIATNRLLKRSEAAWVLHKLDQGIDHILVDEAQDTSREQWDILQAIAEEFTAGQGQRNVTRTFFAVGDEKQSIFSFQGAEPKLFDHMRRQFLTRSAAAGQDFNSLEMKRSFRSSKGILEAVDWIFTPEDHYRGLSSDAKATVHEAWKETLPGVVEFWPFVEPGATEEPRDWKMPLDTRAPNDPPMVVARRIAEEIRSWIAPGSSESVEDESSGGRRRIRPGDVMVLVRTRGPFFESIIRALKEAQVRVAGADRLKLTQHIAVMDLIAAGRAALLPEDDLTLACILKSPLFGLDDNDLIDLAPARPGSLFDALGASEKAAHKNAHARLCGWRKAAQKLTPFQFYARILGAERGRHDMLARLGPEAGEAMDEFLRLALDHETREAPSLFGFLAALQAADLEVKRDMEAGADAVRVMTVHAAKGLEAKIVFLADTCGLPSARHDPKLYEIPAGQFGHMIAWSPGTKAEPKEIGAARDKARRDAEEEYRRLLYVAVTRAEERLYIAGFVGKSGLPNGCWYQMMQSVLERELSAVPARWDPLQTVLRRQTGDLAKLAALADWPAGLDEPALPDWATTPAPFEAAPQRPISPSNALAAADRLEPEPRDGAAFGAEAAHAGRLVHALLQHLPDMPEERRAEAAARFLARRGASFDEARRQALARQALSVLADPLLAALFGPGSRPEVGLGGSIRLPRGRSIAISGQIDRLAVCGGEVLIADFKTGRPRPANETPPAYVAQLALYRAAVAPLYPGLRVRAFLVWTEGPTGTELPEAMLDAALLDV